MSQASEEIQALLAALEYTDKTAVRAAVDSLIERGARSPELAQTLSSLLTERSRKNLWAVAYILAKLPAPPPGALAVLIDTLGFEDPDLRWACALLLVEVARADPRTLARLLDLIKTGAPHQRRMAVYCVRDLNLNDGSSLRALLAALDDPEPLVRVAAVTSLKARSDLGAEGPPRLLDLFLNDPDARVRHSAALIHAQVGAASEEFLAALRRAAEAGDVNEKKVAAAALALLQKKRSAPPER